MIAQSQRPAGVDIALRALGVADVAGVSYRHIRYRAHVPGANVAIEGLAARIAVGKCRWAEKMIHACYGCGIPDGDRAIGSLRIRNVAAIFTHRCP